MVTTKEVFLASIVGEQCVRDVRLWDAQESLVLLVESRFPGLMDRVTIESLTNREQVHEIFKAVLKAESFDDARAAVARILMKSSPSASA